MTQATAIVAPERYDSRNVKLKLGSYRITVADSIFFGLLTVTWILNNFHACTMTVQFHFCAKLLMLSIYAHSLSGFSIKARMSSFKKPFGGVQILRILNLCYIIQHYLQGSCDSFPILSYFVDLYVAHPWVHGVRKLIYTGPNNIS